LSDPVWLGRSTALGKLKADLKARARVAALQGELGEAHRLATEAETVSKLYNPLFGNRFLVAVLAVGIASLGITGLAWLIRRPTAELVIRGKTRSATTYLAARGKAPDLSLTGSRLQLSPLASEQSQNLPELGKRPPSRSGAPTSASLRLSASGGGSGRARPSLLASLAPGAKLGMSAGRDELSVAVFGEALKGAIDVPAGVRVDWEALEGQGDSKKQFEETEPDVVEFQAQMRRTLPFVVSVRDLDQWDLLAEVERELTFSQVANPANPTLEISSGLESATIQFADVEKTLSIPKGDYLQIGMAAPGRLQLRRSAGADGLEFEFEGVVSELRSGRLARLDDRRPTWLQWAAENTAFKAFWSGLVLVWGLIWGILKVKEG
jgi:hypothetical protein